MLTWELPRWHARSLLHRSKAPEDGGPHLDNGETEMMDLVYRLAQAPLPSRQFGRHPTFYLWYDGIWAALCGAALVLMAIGGWPGVLPEPSWWGLLAAPIVLYAQVLGHVFVHNATHRSFPRTINRLVGELCGVWVVTRFASWEIVHQRHHAHADDPERDPHPLVGNFWLFVVKTIVNVEAQLQRAYFERHGDTPANRRYERVRAVVSFLVGGLVVATWFVFWGPFGFFAVFLPAVVLGGLHIMHFNWSTHNGFSADGEFTPVNLDHGLYWLGNRAFFGIYYHANHHRRPGLFNPMHLRPSLPVLIPSNRRGRPRIDPA